MNPTVADRIRTRLEAFTHDLESGKTIQDKYTCRKLEFRLKPMPYNPQAVKQTRKILQASQRVFAMFIGASVKTVQAWEQGVTPPPKMACRLMDEIRRDPDYWIARLKESVVQK
jgi:putative transcriptional regulator